MLAVDDVQWCDSASLRWLAYLVRRLEAVPVLVVGTVRTGEQHADEELLTELSLEPAAVVLRPAALSEATTATLVGKRLGEPVSPLFARACHRTTSGNPLLLRQLLRALEADRVRPDAAHADMVVAVGSRAVSSMVLMRLRRLAGLGARPSPGRPPCWATARRCRSWPRSPSCRRRTRRPRSPPSPGCEIVRDEQPLAFVHPLVREAVYRDLPAAERALRHERAAALLRSAGASDEQVAAHLLLAPVRGDESTVEVLRRAARTAADRGASDSAVTHLRRALAELPAGTARCDVLTELGHLESLIDGAASTEHLLQAYALQRGPVDPRRPRRRDRPHRGVRQPAGHRDGVRPGGGHGAAAGARRPPAGAAGHRADQRLHARTRAVGLADGGARGARRRRAAARACSPPPSPSRR